MSYFEYIFTGILTPDIEQRSTRLLNEMNNYYAPPFSIQKIVDETLDEEKKQRTIIIHSRIHVADYLTSVFSGCEMKLTCYWKQRII